MRTALTLAFVSMLVACGAMPSAGAKLQEASQELNVNARFGRMEMAVEHVAPAEREQFARRHRWWGGKIRIADSESAGTRVTGQGEAEVTVKVAWYRPNEQELHVTTIKQKWKDVSGEWKLVGETRTDGDPGLIDDAPPAEPAASAAPGAPPPPRKIFPTVRIGAVDDDAQ